MSVTFRLYFLHKTLYLALRALYLVLRTWYFVCYSSVNFSFIISILTANIRATVINVNLGLSEYK